MLRCSDLLFFFHRLLQSAGTRCPVFHPERLIRRLCFITPGFTPVHFILDHDADSHLSVKSFVRPIFLKAVMMSARHCLAFPLLKLSRPICSSVFCVVWYKYEGQLMSSRKNSSHFCLKKLLDSHYGFAQDPCLRVFLWRESVQSFCQSFASIASLLVVTAKAPLTALPCELTVVEGQAYLLSWQAVDPSA